MWLGWVCIFNDVFYETQLQSLQYRLRDDALLIAESLREYLIEDAAGDHINLQVEFWAQLIDSRVTVISRDGVVLGESHQDYTEMDNHLLRPEIQAALRGGIGVQIRYSQTVKYEMLYTALPVTEDGEAIGFIRVSLPLNEIKANQAQTRNTILLATTMASGLGAVLSIIIAHLITRPLNTLIRGANLMVQGDEVRRLPSLKRDEVGQLSQAFNTLVEKLHAQISALQSEEGSFIRPGKNDRWGRDCGCRRKYHPYQFSSREDV